MVTARFLPILFVLAVAGSLAGKKVAPAGAGHDAHRQPDLRRPADRRDRDLVGALTFFPALLLGPIVQGLTTRLF